MAPKVRFIAHGCVVAIIISLVSLRAIAEADPVAELRAHLVNKGSPFAPQPFVSAPLSKEAAASGAALLWDDQAAQLRPQREQEWKDRKLTEGDKVMPFAFTVFGEKPKNGRSLFISMHGGGNAAPRVNDQQWENQKRLYRPAEGVYLAPRAPTNTWNLWHESHIDRMFGRLIEDAILFEGVDPDRVYLTGYSAGGDGSYQLAPRMADRFAAAAMMAGHPNDASPLGLRNLPFAIHVGALDGGFKRNQVAAEWGKKLDDLRKSDPAGYEHVAKLHDGKGHWMDRQDGEAIPWMAGFTRNARPTRVVWKQGGTTHDRFYWLAVPAGSAKAGQLIEARIEGQTIAVTSNDVARLFVRLDDKLVDLDQLVTVMFNGTKVFEGRAKRTIGTMAKILAERADPGAMFSAEIEIGVAGK